MWQVSLNVAYQTLRGRSGTLDPDFEYTEAMRSQASGIRICDRPLESVTPLSRTAAAQPGPSTSITAKAQAYSYQGLLIVWGAMDWMWWWKEFIEGGTSWNYSKPPNHQEEDPHPRRTMTSHLFIHTDPYLITHFSGSHGCTEISQSVQPLASVSLAHKGDSSSL